MYMYFKHCQCTTPLSATSLSLSCCIYIYLYIFIYIYILQALTVHHTPLPCLCLHTSSAYRDSFGVSPHALAGVRSGEPGVCGGRDMHIRIHLHLHIYTYVYIYHYIYTHVFTYVYHTCILTYINICISHVYIYIHTRMYIKHQRHPRHAYESPSRVPRRSCALSSAALLFQHAGVRIDTHRKTCIGSRSFGKASWGRRCVCVRAQVCICVGA